MAQTPTVLTIELTDALIPGRELQLAGPESITTDWAYGFRGGQ